MRHREKRSWIGVAAILLAGASSTFAPVVTAQNPRPMTFLDMQLMRQVGAPTPSPDGQWLLYTLSTPDWKEAKRQTDIYLVSLQQGLSSTRQMTFTKEKNETSPAWARDGRALRLPVEPRGAGKRVEPQPALRDAPRRRRGAPHHRRERRRRPTTPSAATAAGSCIAAARAARNSSIACRSPASRPPARDS